MVRSTMTSTSQKQAVEQAFLAAYEAHADSVFRFLAMKVSSRETAQDLAQETFTRAWDYCRDGGVIREWKPFLFRTAYNLVVDTYRKKRSVSLDAMIEDHDFAIPDPDDVRSINRAEAARVRDAIDLLDETYRDVLILRFTEDLPPKEIARITGLSENVVSVRIHRGVQKLREHLDPNVKK